ncbi:Leucine-rich repeat [Trypanosoma melophagium]|uniref:Leucine-rich repeat n=1 Tax=Trypanosoma melophagium TaxID=715481 RepID=UPI00351AA8AC|nr:Leucine-rich repeat [Trypanosoma melophagium]
MFASVGVSEDQVFGELYLAWLKDTGEKNTNDSRKLFREVIERGFGERQIVMRKERLGANVAASLAALLHRSPLTRLDLHGNTLRDSGCEMLAHLIRDLPNLLYLDLGANDIGPLGIQFLSFVVATHKKLQTLILGSSKSDAYANRINETSATMLLEGCLRSRTLRHLDVSGSSIGDRGMANSVSMSNSSGSGVTINTVKQRITMTELALRPPSHGSNSRATSAAARNRYVSVASAAGTKSGTATDEGSNILGIGGGHRRPIDVLAELITTSTTLTTLKLREVQLTTDAALRLIYAATQSSSFAFIDLSGNALTGAVGDAFGDLIHGRAVQKNPSALHTILLSNNPLMQPNSNMVPPRIFSSLASDRIVVRLHLDNCGVDDTAMGTLCQALSSNEALQTLHLKHNAITSDGAVSLARALYQHACLQDVSLEGNILRDEGACAFASMLEANCKLLSLNLAHTWMGERGVIALGVSLAENKTLQRLHIGENHITEDAGEAFAALLESNHSLLRCDLQGNSVGHHTVLRVEKVMARNREAYNNREKVELEKDVIRLHYQMYKLDEARAELEELQQKKLELGRALDAFEVQFKQEKSDCSKRERELQEALENGLQTETQCHEAKARLDEELLAAQRQTETDVAAARERLEVEVALRAEVEAAHAALRAELEDALNNGPQREAAKREQLRELQEDTHRWSAQRKEYKSTIAEVQAVVNQLMEKSNAAGGKKKKKGKKAK